MAAKTNVMRIFERAQVPYEPLFYDLGKQEFSGAAVAALTGVPAEQMYKTLTAAGRKTGFLVFIIPVSDELDLKKAAQAAGEKSVELVPVKDLLKITGYMRGEVSPVGMKKQYPSFLHKGAAQWDKIAISAGKKGCSLWTSPSDLVKLLGGSMADLLQ